VLKRLTLEGMSSVAFSPDGRWLVVGGTDFQFLEVGTWVVKRRLERPIGEVFPPAMAFSRDGKILALCHAWRTIRLINPHTGEEIATLEAPQAVAHFFAQFQCGCVIAGGGGGTLAGMSRLESAADSPATGVDEPRLGHAALPAGRSSAHQSSLARDCSHQRAGRLDRGCQEVSTPS